MRIIAALTVGLLLLSGCTGEPEVREPDPTASASPEAPPPMPAQAKEDTDEGAVAFVKHWIDVFNHATATGNVDDLRRLSDPACDECQDYVELFESTYSKGGYFKGGDWTVVDMAIDKAENEVVYIQFQADPARYKPDSESPERTGKPEEASLVFELTGDPDERRVSLLGRTQS